MRSKFGETAIVSSLQGGNTPAGPPDMPLENLPKIRAYPQFCDDFHHRNAAFKTGPNAASIPPLAFP
jgi:hypothetical protein